MPQIKGSRHEISGRFDRTASVRTEGSIQCLQRLAVVSKGRATDCPHSDSIRLSLWPLLKGSQRPFQLAAADWLARPRLGANVRFWPKPVLAVLILRSSTLLTSA